MADSRRKRIIINDFCVSEDFFEHEKTAHLAELCGFMAPGDDEEELKFHRVKDSLWRLWRWSTCRGGPDGRHSGNLGSIPRVIAHHANWRGDPSELLTLLTEAGFLDELQGDDGKAWFLHGLQENQPHVLTILDKLEASRANGNRGGRPKKGNPEETQPKPSETQPEPKKTQDNLAETQANLAKPSEAEAEAEAEAEGRGEEGLPSAPLSDPNGSDPPSPDHTREVLDEWEALAKELDLPGKDGLRATSKRRVAVRQRVRQQGWLTDYREALARIRETRPAFLLGDNQRGWRANLDWILRPDSVSGVLEGKYDGKPRAAPGHQTRDDMAREVMDHVYRTLTEDQEGQPHEPAEDPNG